MLPRIGSFCRSLSLALVFAALAGCGGDERSTTVSSLLDGSAVPEVLTEQREIAFPPSLSGNRFVQGWWAWRDGQGRTVLNPQGKESRLELVSLDGRARTLVLDLLAAAPGKSVAVTCAGRLVGRFPLTDPLEIPLPPDLPLGRVPVGLAFDPDSPGVVAGAVRSALAAGTVKIEGQDVVQAGGTMVDAYAEAPIFNQTLVGTFVPPSSPRPGQRFDLILERADGTPIRRFTWAPSFWNRFRGARPVVMPLRNNSGVVRARFVARGEGPPARWQGFSFTAAKAGLGGLISGVLQSYDVAAPAPAPEAAAPPPQPPRPGTPPPRVVIVYVFDALRTDALGHLGGPAGVSPTFDRLAAEGITLKAHRSVAPNTLPSTKALFTGRPFVARGGWKLAPEDGPTLAEAFGRAGYRTGLFSGNAYVGPAYGTDRGFEKVAEIPIEESAPVNDNAAHVQKAALDWLASLPAGSKAFLYLHTIHPHNPYAPPEPFRSRFTGTIPSGIDGRTETLLGIKQGRVTATAADQERLRALYHGSVAYNDSQLAAFVREVTAHVPPGEVLLALTADHGEELFDHGGVLHGFTLYEEMLRIPLVLWSPGRLTRGASEDLSDSLDLHATLLDLAGLEPDARVEGKTLLPRQNPEAGIVEPEIRYAAASSVKGGMYMARSKRFKYVWAPRAGLGWGMGEGVGRSHDAEYVFDLERDPKEKANLAGQSLTSIEPAWLKARLLAWIEKGGGREGEKAQEAPVDPETIDRLRALGYVN